MRRWCHCVWVIDVTGTTIWDALAQAAGKPSAELRSCFGTPWEAAETLGVPDDAWLPAAAQVARVPVAAERSLGGVAAALLPERWARRYGVAPVAASDAWIEIATAAPDDVDCERAIGFATGRSVRFVLASPRRIAEWTERAYFQGGERQERGDVQPASVAGEVQHLSETEGPQGDATRSLGDEVTRLVDVLLSDGIRAGASDVHLEPEEQGIVVRHRIDGVLRDVRTLPRTVGPALASRVKIISGLDIADRLRPQDGRARVAVNGRPLDLRISTLPASHGEKLVIRILDGSGGERTLAAMGFAPPELSRIARLLEAREGLILVTGPTGSGKTTTLYAALREIKQRGVNIVTVEDPVEYRIPGIVQVQVRDRSGLTFASALRSIMRQDPDVILVGEIRDRETAEIAIQASLTGHLVLSTLHTNDAASAATRLADMGIPAVKVATALKGIVAQRLLRHVCTTCATLQPVEDASGRFGAPPGACVLAAAGCAVCGGTGYRGRLAIVEVLLATPEVERTIASGAAAEDVAEAARRSGMQPLWASGMARVMGGETTLEELLRVAEPPAADAAAPRLVPGLLARHDAAQVTLHSPSEQQPETRDARAGQGTLPQHHEDGVTEIKVGTIDVYVIRPLPEGWRVLLLQRALDTRCPTAWETVHGRLEPGEEPDAGAIRELREETGLTAERFYVVAAQPYYLKAMRSVQISIAFAAFVAEPAEVTLGSEHQRHEWVTVEEALTRFAWPRERQALEEIRALLASGDGGAVDDVLRVF